MNHSFFKIEKYIKQHYIEEKKKLKNLNNREKKNMLKPTRLGGGHRCCQVKDFWRERDGQQQPFLVLKISDILLSVCSLQLPCES